VENRIWFKYHDTFMRHVKRNYDDFESTLK